MLRIVRLKVILRRIRVFSKKITWLSSNHQFTQVRSSSVEWVLHFPAIHRSKKVDARPNFRFFQSHMVHSVTLFIISYPDWWIQYVTIFGTQATSLRDTHPSLTYIARGQHPLNSPLTFVWVSIQAASILHRQTCTASSTHWIRTILFLTITPQLCGKNIGFLRQTNLLRHTISH